MSTKMLKTAFLGLVLSVSGFANAGLITGELNTDNHQTTYLSTDNNTQGVHISDSLNFEWMTTDYFEYELESGVNYFLHIAATDKGGIASLLGNFFLSGNSHVFANGTSSLVTNDLLWQVSTTGWNNYESATVHGNWGDSPWGTSHISAIDQDAKWIWSTDAHNDNAVFFSVEIKAVPEPSTLAIFALGIMGLASRRFKKQ